MEWLPTLFCRLSVVWIDSCTGRTIKPIKPNQPAKQKFELLVVWLFTVRKNGTGSTLNDPIQELHP